MELEEVRKIPSLGNNKQLNVSMASESPNKRQTGHKEPQNNDDGG